MGATVSKHFRFTNEQAKRLADISKALDMTETDVIRMSLDNVSVDGMRGLSEKKEDEALLKVESIAVRKYENYLLSNATNNLNQIAKNLNRILKTNDVFDLVDESDLSRELTNVFVELSELKHEIKKRGDER